MVVVSAAAASSCRVWVRSNPCFFGFSAFDTVASSFGRVISPNDHRHHYDRMLVSLEEKEGNVHLSTFDGNDIIDPSSASLLPLGRARFCPPLGSTACPTTVLETQVATKKAAATIEKTKPYVQLAVVGMVLDPTTQRLLITRRPTYMRSFPGAWVFPGGGVDPSESLSQAIAREVWEETGLVIEDWTLESVWESVYPTIPEPEVPIQAHHLVVYMSGELAASSSPQQLQLCKVEVDDAVWLSRKNVQDILQVMSSEEERQGVSNHQSKVTMCTKTGDDETVDISLKDLVGIYPQTGDRGDFSHGMAQGSLFALEEMWSSRTGKTASQ